MQEEILNELKQSIFKNIKLMASCTCFICQENIDYDFFIQLNNGKHICVHCLSSAEIYDYYKKLCSSKMKEESLIPSNIQEVFDHWPELPPHWELLRNLVLERDQKLCQIDGCPSRTPLQIHHKEAKSKGGSHQIKNLITYCTIHHSYQEGKGHKEILISLKKSDSFTIVSNRTYRGKKIKPYIRAKSRAENNEIQEIINLQEVVCQKCNELILITGTKKKVQAYCKKCKELRIFPRYLLEITAPLIVSSYLVKNRRQDCHDDRWYKTQLYEKKTVFKEYDDCPLCNKKLVLREQKNNQKKFIGCSNFPNCNFTSSC